MRHVHVETSKFVNYVSVIFTAATQLQGDGVREHCRTPEIMADAAYSILTSDSRRYTGKFAIDDDVLFEDGTRDFSKYKCVPCK